MKKLIKRLLFGKPSNSHSPLIMVYQPQKTYQLKTHDGEVFDSQVPIELAKSFIAVTKKFEETSNGKYHCTPLIFEEEKGLSVGIIEVKDDGTHFKLPFNLTIN
jgi:hypothetical protein